MACPLFYPAQKLESAAASRISGTPLGDAYEGECCARQDGHRPAEDELLQFCNLGYARKKCPRFPADLGPDAVRFCISHDEEERFVIRYVQERDHQPWQHGWLEYDVAGRKFIEPHLNRIVNRLAEAYAEAYLRHKKSSPAAETAQPVGSTPAENAKSHP